VNHLATRLLSGAVLAATVALAAPTDVVAQDAPPEVTYRKGLMQAMRYNITQLRSTGDLGHGSHAVHYARALYGNAEMLTDAFAEGSTGEGSRALAAIWQNRSGFRDAVEAYQTAAAHLLEAAEMRNTAAMGRAAQAMGASCGGCHEPFRAENN